MKRLGKKIGILFIIFIIFRGRKKLGIMVFTGFLLGLLLRFIGTFTTIYWDFYYDL